jgi:hypothetical protein
VIDLTLDIENEVPAAKKRKISASSSGVNNAVKSKTITKTQSVTKRSKSSNTSEKASTSQPIRSKPKKSVANRGTRPFPLALDDEDAPISSKKQTRTASVKKRVTSSSVEPRERDPNDNDDSDIEELEADNESEPLAGRLSAFKSTKGRKLAKKVQEEIGYVLHVSCDNNILTCPMTSSDEAVIH